MNASEIKVRPGDRVRIHAPDEFHVHECPATVERITDWGAFLVVHRPRREYDVPDHVPRWRAFWSEMIPQSGAGPARQQGYTGNICFRCQGSRVVRQGTCEFCLDCAESLNGCV